MQNPLIIQKIKIKNEKDARYGYWKNLFGRNSQCGTVNNVKKNFVQ